MKYETCFKDSLAFIEKKLQKALRARERSPAIIHKAMQYAAFTGGKRFRPVLTLAACEACGGKPQDAIAGALAIELIHTYSLVHDDLPALDNDDMRRGHPTCHRKFGEANAILAGDALLTLAFELLTEAQPEEKAIRLVREVALAAGVHGMIGGQVADLAGESRKKSLKEHLYISRCKTGQLIRVSALAGALSAGASPRQVRAITHYGECLGLAFQVVDDLLDKDGFCDVMSPPSGCRESGAAYRAGKSGGKKLRPARREIKLSGGFFDVENPLNAQRAKESVSWKQTGSAGSTARRT